MLFSLFSLCGMEVIEKIVKIKEANGFRSFRAFALFINFSHSYLSKILKGTHPVPTSLINAIACKFNVDIECLNNPFSNTIKQRHGLSLDASGKPSRLHGIWSGMLYRCYNPKAEGYKYYGGRGITVCEEWRNNYKAFHDWAIANGYGDDLTIERNRVNGNYEPGNCRWITPQEQSKNKRTTINIAFNGETKCLADWARQMGLSPSTLKGRLIRLPIEQAMMVRKIEAP